MQKLLHQQLQDFLNAGDYTGAKNYLLSISQDLVNDADYWYYLAHISRKLGDLKQAEKYCNKSLQISTDFRDANFELGIIYQINGKYKKAIEVFHKVVKDTPPDARYTDLVDVLNSLALTYKKCGDSINALKYYNLSLETLAQKIYEDTKNQPLQSINFNHTGIPAEGWMRLALQIAVKNAAKDEIKKVLIPDGETVAKFLRENPLIGFTMHDKDGARYLLPAYFSAFFIALNSNILFSNLVNNIGTLYAETGNIEEARKCFKEAIEFIPSGVEYKAPFVGLESLGK